jgi:hypothetical protein
MLYLLWLAFFTVAAVLAAAVSVTVAFGVLAQVAIVFISVAAAVAVAGSLNSPLLSHAVKAIF